MDSSPMEYDDGNIILIIFFGKQNFPPLIGTYF